MNKIILLKVGEIALKGLNRKTFEDRLRGNIKRRLKDIGRFNVNCAQSALYVENTDGNEEEINLAFDACKSVFGVAALSIAAECEKNIISIRDTAIEFLRDDLRAASSFKVESKRSDKNFPMTSPVLSSQIGGDILEAYPHLTVDVHNPDITVNVEIRETAAYVHGKTSEGAGGMPVGTGGRSMLLLSGGIDSPVAGYMMAKRGVELLAVHFESPPYTSERARMKVLSLAGIMQKYCGNIRVFVVPFTDIQLSIRDNCPEDLFTLIMRRIMMRIACRLSENYECRALVTGESLGQVASQTLDALCVTDIVADRPVFRPLIGMDKEEIVRIARKIGTFETSILPFEDCCTVFTPKHPRLRPRGEMITAAESKLDIESLIDKACSETAEYPAGIE